MATIKAVLHTNEQSVDRVLQAGLPVVLVFWHSGQSGSDAADLLDDLAVDYAGRALIARVDASSEAGLVRRFGVQHLPTYVFVKEGEVQATLPGPLRKETLRDWLRYLTEGGERPPLPADSRQPHASQASDTPLHLTDRTFDQVIGGDRPVLVDFWAEWCGPCRMIAPSIDQLAKEFAGRAVVAKLNVDENQRTAQRFNVMSIPMLAIFRNGKMVDQMVGVQPLPVLRQRLAQHVT